MNEQATSENFDVLIVDDEGVVVESILKAGGLLGLRCDTATDVPSAIEKLGLRRYRMAFADLMLPGGDGFTVLKELQKAQPQVPTIIVTGFSTMANATKAFVCGAFDFLPKPFDFDEILGILSRALALGDCVTSFPRPARYYLGRHSWILTPLEGAARIGAAQCFCGRLPQLSKIELPAVGSMLQQGKACAHLYEDDEKSHTIWAPADGRVIEVNHALLENPALVNEDPFDTGWICTISPSQFTLQTENLSLR